jgi:hypothetical protein
MASEGAATTFSIGRSAPPPLALWGPISHEIGANCGWERVLGALQEPAPADEVAEDDDVAAVRQHQLEVATPQR